MGFVGSLVGKALINARGLVSAGRISLTFVVATLGIIADSSCHLGVGNNRLSPVALMTSSGEYLSV